MTISERMIEELTREGASTRRLLERVPDDKLGWKPHPKSMSLGQLAEHLAGLPGAIVELVSELSREAPRPPLPQANSTAEIVAKFDNSMAKAKERLASWSDEDLRAPWQMVRGGKTLLEIPRQQALRAIMLNHSYHHRGQLTVYLRLLDVPLPAIYGSSADEQPFG